MEIIKLIERAISAYEDFIQTEKLFVKVRELEVAQRVKELAFQVKCWETHMDEHKKKEDKGFE